MQATVSNTRQEFLGTYKLQNESVQKVFRYISWLARHFKVVFVLRSRIANFIAMAIRTVARALKKLVELGWISIYTRSNRSSVYMLNPDLMTIDVDDKSLWKNPDLQSECPPHVPRSLNLISCKENHYQEIDADGFQMEELQQEIHEVFKVPGLKLWEQVLLAKKFAIGQMVLARENARNYLDKGYKIENPLGFLYNAAKNAYALKPWNK